MSARLDQIKLELVSKSFQVTLFNLKGEVIESCDTLVQISRAESAYDQFDFLKSLEDVIPSLPIHEKLAFPAVEWEEQIKGLFSITFERVETDVVQWVIQDNSGLKEDTLKVQQERNNATINEEFLEIQQRYLEMEKELLSYKNDELQRVQEFKSMFFAEVSHEMRTPLNSIGGLISLLQENQIERNPEYLSALRATSNHLNSVINDVLDLSKVEAGKLTLDEADFDIRKVLQNIITGFSLLAKKKDLSLNLEIADQIPQHIVGDPTRLSQVIYNLLGNALKFTGQGSVSISINHSGYESELHQLSFEIKDTGKGMSKEGIANILEPYAQADGQSYHHGGTGLGMGIANQLISIMGGKLVIESELGKGTSMGFELGFKEGQLVPTESRAESVDLSHLKVLVAEDDPVSQLLLKNLLEQSGAQYQVVSSLAAFKKVLIDQSFDLVLTDINLEGGRSIDVLIDLESHLQVPIVFLSGDDQSRFPELKKLIEWQFLKKPFEPSELVSLLGAIEKSVKLDLTNLRMVTQNSADLMKELIDIILETLPVELERLEGAMKIEDFKSAEKILHKVNPSISYLGIRALISERKVLYDAVVAGEDISGNYPMFIEQASLAIEQLQKEEL